MPIAALVAMKPSLEQTTLVGVQRVAGALIGAAAAVLLLLIPASQHGLRLLACSSPACSPSVQPPRNSQHPLARPYDQKSGHGSQAGRADARPNDRGGVPLAVRPAARPGALEPG